MKTRATCVVATTARSGRFLLAFCLAVMAIGAAQSDAMTIRDAAGREVKVVRLDRYQHKSGDVGSASKRRERGDKFN